MEKKNNKEIESRVVPRDIVPEMKESYLDYAMSVIVARALPDIKDGLKPVHRRILYTMHEMGLAASSKFRKSAAVTGLVIAYYHPHGDIAVYDSLVKMAQTFSTRYPLILGQGNFGSMDGDAPASMRYTETKMSKIAGEMLSDIEKETVSFRANYDNTRKEPIILPSPLPMLLLNGTVGIAVGMATKIPPHNLTEVCDALLHLADNKNVTTEDLLKFVKGPDFPTGGIIYNEKDIHHAYANGRGGIVVRGEADIVEDEKGLSQIIVTSIPYQVNKSELIIKIADLVRDKKIDGIKDIRDESTKDVRIAIDLKSGSFPQKILNSLYKHTDLEVTYHFNILALVDNVPKILSLKTILEEFIKHRNEIVVKRTKFELKKAEGREHILTGLKRALDHIDEIIKTIKKAKDTNDAHKNLCKEFSLTKIQATAILEMRLQKLAGLERKKIEEELKEKRTLISELKKILADPKKVLSIIKKEFEELKEKYGDDRRTKIVRYGAKAISIEDIIPDEEQMLVLTSGGYVKRSAPSEYRVQKRGGVGAMDLSTKEEDFVNISVTASTHSDLLFFTDKGKVYQIKMYDIPEGKRATKGKSIANFLSIQEGEKITSVLALPKDVKKSPFSALLITRCGVVKKVPGDSFTDVRRSGIIAMKLAKGDELFKALKVDKGDSAILVSQDGQSIRFLESDARHMGRSARGIRGMRIKKDDMLVGADVIKKDADKNVSLLVVSEKGYGKKTKEKEYKKQKRGGSGIKTAKVTTKTGRLITASVITESTKELIAISKKGTAIRLALSDVPTLGRQTQGVRIMKLREDDKLASITCI